MPAWSRLAWWRGEEHVPEGARELAFETARRVGAGFAFREFLIEVGGRKDVHAFTERDSRDRQRVEIRLARLAHAASRPAGLAGPDQDLVFGR